jgi:cbb3-type cytochrome oxidase cytochrome c subunit
MNNGPFLFLGSFVAMLLSWLGLIVVPQIQLRDLQPAKNETTGQFFPVPRLGLARQGAEVYRANGCNACHSQQVRQTGYHFDAVIEKGGNDPDALAKALVTLNSDWSVDDAALFAEGDVLELGPIDLGRKTRLEQLLDSAKIGDHEAKIRFDLNPTGPDIARGWGLRASVARDYLYEDTLMLGSQRIGPDLSNVGARLPEKDWHLRHLYHPRTEVKDSTMPAYQFLFEVRPIGDTPSPNALKLEPEFAPPAGHEVVPTAEALALVAYLQSLKVTAALYEAPAPVVE